MGNSQAEKHDYQPVSSFTPEEIKKIMVSSGSLSDGVKTYKDGDAYAFAVFSVLWTLPSVSEDDLCHDPMFGQVVAKEWLDARNKGRLLQSPIVTACQFLEEIKK